MRRQLYVVHNLTDLPHGWTFLRSKKQGSLTRNLGMVVAQIAWPLANYAATGTPPLDFSRPLAKKDKSRRYT